MTAAEATTGAEVKTGPEVTARAEFTAGAAVTGSRAEKGPGADVLVLSEVAAGAVKALRVRGTGAKAGLTAGTLSRAAAADLAEPEATQSPDAREVGAPEIGRSRVLEADIAGSSDISTSPGWPSEALLAAKAAP